MKLESWISLQQHTIDRLRVWSGAYVCRYSAVAREYRAALQLATPGVRDVVSVVTRTDTTRVRVTIAGTETDFAPRWQPGSGLAVARLVPAEMSAVGAREAAGYARAALLAAALEEHELLGGIAHDVAERCGVSASQLLIGLTTGSMELRHRGLVAEVLVEHAAGVDFVQVRRDCACLVCGRTFRRGDTGPVREVGTLVGCAECLCLGHWVLRTAPSAGVLWRAAGDSHVRKTMPVAPPIVPRDLAREVADADGILIDQEHGAR